jgi:hypothetical protein
MMPYCESDPYLNDHTHTWYQSISGLGLPVDWLGIEIFLPSRLDYVLYTDLPNPPIASGEDMNLISDTIQDFCASEHFFFLDPVLKESAESILKFWCDQTGEEMTDITIDAAMQQVAVMKVSLPIRKAFPGLLTAFFDYLASSGRFPQAEQWGAVVHQREKAYRESFREDGTVRGETFRKGYPAVGRNDPCPCGSGKKYKKCCYGIFS